MLGLGDGNSLVGLLEKSRDDSAFKAATIASGRTWVIPRGALLWRYWLTLLATSNEMPHYSCCAGAGMIIL